MDAAAERHPEVPYRAAADRRDVRAPDREHGAPLVILTLNRDGDILSDLVLPLFGSIAGSESLLVAFDDDYVPDASWRRRRTGRPCRSTGRTWRT